MPVLVPAVQHRKTGESRPAEPGLDESPTLAHGPAESPTTGVSARGANVAAAQVRLYRQDEVERARLIAGVALDLHQQFVTATKAR